MTPGLVTREERELPLAVIDEPALPTRSTMDEEKMDQLVASIRAHGLIAAISVIERDDLRYEVVCGHRRRIACARAGLATMKCYVYPKDADVTVIQAHENSRREDVNPADEAAWFDDLLKEKCGGDIEKLCGLVGEKLSYVDNRLALFRGDQRVFEALQRGEIKIGVAHELNKLPDDGYRLYYLRQAIRTGATVAAVTGWISEWRRTFENVPPSSPAPAPAALSEPGEQYDPHRCHICGKNDPRYVPELISVHTHCKRAILEPLLATYRGE